MWETRSVIQNVRAPGKASQSSWRWWLAPFTTVREAHFLEGTGLMFLRTCFPTTSCSWGWYPWMAPDNTTPKAHSPNHLVWLEWQPWLSAIFPPRHVLFSLSARSCESQTSWYAISISLPSRQAKFRWHDVPEPHQPRLLYERKRRSRVHPKTSS